MRASLLVFGFIVLWLPFASAGAQDARIEGEVIDNESGETLPQANVQLVGLDRGMPSDGEGRFRFGGLSAGNYTVRVSYIGYVASETEVSVDSGETVEVTIRLRPADIEAGELVVEGIREREVQNLSAARITAAEVQQLPTVLEPDLFRTIQLLPGVQAASDFSSGLYIRGGTPDQTLILLDGAPIYNPSHVFGFFSTFNPDAIASADVFKGGYPARYGGRLGSVVDVANRPGSTEEYGGRVSLGLLASRFSVQGPLPEGSFMVALRRSTMEPLLAALNSADISGIPKSFYFYDLNAKARLNLSENDRLTLAGYLGQDQLDYPFLDDLRFDVGYGNRTFSANWQRVLSDATFANLRFTASRYGSAPKAQISGTNFQQENEVFDYGLEAAFSSDLNDEHTLDAGLEGRLFSFNLRNEFDGETQLEQSIDSGMAAGFIQNTYQPTDDLRLQAGLRTSYFGSGGFWRLGPRLTAQYDIRENLRIQAGYGRYSQYLTLVTSELASAFDIWLTTGEDVPPSYGDQFVIGAETQLASDLHLDVEAYYRTMNQLFELDPLLPDESGLSYRERFHFGEGYAYGAEFFLEKREGPLTGFVSYTLSWTQRRFDGFEGGQYFPPKYDRRHDLTVTGQYPLSDNWEATGVFTLASGQAYTEPDSQYRLFDSPFTSQAMLVLQSDFNADRLPAYHRLDLGAQHSGQLFDIGQYELQLQLVNVYGQRNIWFYLFNVNEDGDLERTDIPQIPIPLPNISFTVSF